MPETLEKESPDRGVRCVCRVCVCVCVCMYNFRKTAACRTAARRDSASEESLRTV